LFGALAVNLAHTIVLLRLGQSFGYALASFLFIAANLVIFFVWNLSDKSSDQRLDRCAWELV
jgi:hypothetical protein